MRPILARGLLADLAGRAGLILWLNEPFMHLIDGVGVVSFEAKAALDLNICFSSDPHGVIPTQDGRDDGAPDIEIVVGGWLNTKTAIRLRGQIVRAVTKRENADASIASPTEFHRYWVFVCDRCVLFGKGESIGSRTVLEHVFTAEEQERRRMRDRTLSVGFTTWGSPVLIRNVFVYPGLEPPESYRARMGASATRLEHLANSPSPARRAALELLTDVGFVFSPSPAVIAVRAHALLLAAASPVFADLFAGTSGSARSSSAPFCEPTTSQPWFVFDRVQPPDEHSTKPCAVFRASPALHNTVLVELLNYIYGARDLAQCAAETRELARAWRVLDAAQADAAQAGAAQADAAQADSARADAAVPAALTADRAPALAAAAWRPCFLRPSMFAGLRRASLPADVELLLDDGTRLFAHRVLLAAWSDYFAIMWSCGMRESREGRVSLAGVDAAELAAVLAYTDSGSLAVPLAGDEPAADGVVGVDDALDAAAAEPGGEAGGALAGPAESRAAAAEPLVRLDSEDEAQAMRALAAGASAGALAPGGGDARDGRLLQIASPLGRLPASASVRHSSALGMLTVADRLGMNEIKSYCEALQYSLLSVRNCCQTAYVAELMHCADLRHGAARFMAEHAGAVLGAPVRRLRYLSRDSLLAVIELVRGRMASAVEPDEAAELERELLLGVLNWDAVRRSTDGADSGSDADPAAYDSHVTDLLLAIGATAMPAELLARLRTCYAHAPSVLAALAAVGPAVSGGVRVRTQHTRTSAASEAAAFVVGQPGETEAMLRAGRVPLLFGHNGDQNGVVYYCGLGRGASSSFVCPHDTGMCLVDCSSPESRYTKRRRLVDRKGGTLNTASGQPAWWQLDLTEGHSLLCNRYSVRHGRTNDNYLRSWLLEATNDVTLQDWVQLRVHEGDSALCFPGQYASWDVPTAGREPYRFFRLRLGGSGRGEIAIAEFELYGYYK